MAAEPNVIDAAISMELSMAETEGRAGFMGSLPIVAGVPIQDGASGVKRHGLDSHDQSSVEFV